MIFALWLLRVLIILMILRYVGTFFGRRGPVPSTRRAPPRPPAERPGGRLVRDPQCGTFVPESGALALTRGRTTEHFCSTTCRDAWALAHPK
jgi:uncharacterized protein